MFDLTVVKEKELRGAAHNVLNVAQRDCKIPPKSRGRVHLLKALGLIQYGSRGGKKVTIPTLRLICTGVKVSGSDNRSPFWRARPKSTGAQVTLLQRQQTVASAPFQTLCGHFLSQQLKRTVVGGKEEDEGGKKEPPSPHS